MRHRVNKTYLGRNTEQRKSLFKNLLRSLFEHGYIETTEQKAKAIKGIADKLIYRAKSGTVPARRLIARFFGLRSMANRLVDEVAPVMNDRSSGFTRIIRLGKRRGDDSMMVKMELVATPKEKEETKAKKANLAPIVGKTEKKKATKQVSKAE